MIKIDVNTLGNIVVLAINGEFYIESIGYAEKIWKEVTDGKPEVIGINCENINFIDSSAIGALVNFLNNTVKQGIELVFFNLSQSVSSVFKTARLNHFFNILSKAEFEMLYLKK